jgi:hypothetical protein
MNLRAIDQFHKTRLGYLVFGLVELGLASLVSFKAIGTGSLWLWTLTFILLVGFLQNFGRMAITGHGATVMRRESK